MVVNIYVTNTTGITLSDRFTILQNVKPVTLASRHARMSNMRSDREDEYKGRRIYDRLALKPIVDAASQLQRRPLKQRIGVVNRQSRFNYNRLGINNRKMSTNVKRVRPFGRPRATGFVPKRDNRFNKNFRHNSTRGKGQVKQINSDNNIQNNNQYNVNFTRGRGNRRRGIFRNQSQIQTNEASNSANIGRGRGRNQKRGINRSWFAQKTPPTKEELDKQLDSYMAGSKSQLDRELDMYMCEMDVDLV